MPSQTQLSKPAIPSPGKITSCVLSSDKDALTIVFPDATFTFHAQWLHDSRCDKGESRSFSTAYCQTSSGKRITSAQGSGANLEITWEDNTSSQYPAAWLRAMAPLVAKSYDNHTITEPAPGYTKGWLVNNLQIPHISWHDIFSPENSEATKAEVLHHLLEETATGFIKVVDLPQPNIEDERNKTNTLVTLVLKELFGSVFTHPRRGSDQTFSVSSHHVEDAKRGENLPNYDTNQILLPHVDHAHYTHPIRVQGWYCLEGESINTFVSSLAALETLKEEEPELYEYLYKAPMTVGRAVHYYDPPMYQQTVDTAVTLHPGSDKVKRVRWHPHLTGMLVAPYEQFDNARRVQQKYQEILRRDNHMLSVVLKPGDLYIWDNFRMLHGRESVTKVPRTGVGQTVPEQVVADTYRSMQIEKAKKHLDEKWLVHLPTSQLEYLVKLVEAEA